MYTPTYGYSPGNPSSSQYQNGSSQPPHQQPPSHNPQQQQQRQQQPPHHPHLQQQHSSQTPQTPGQQPQHMMYNAQAPSQYQQQPIGGIHQSPYGASGPSMGGNAGGMGMMQNNGMAHMAGPHGMLHTIADLLVPTTNTYECLRVCALSLPLPSSSLNTVTSDKAIASYASLPPLGSVVVTQDQQCACRCCRTE
jgi:hypothetical protein